MKRVYIPSIIFGCFLMASCSVSREPNMSSDLGSRKLITTQNPISQVAKKNNMMASESHDPKFDDGQLAPIVGISKFDVDNRNTTARQKKQTVVRNFVHKPFNALLQIALLPKVAAQARNLIKGEKAIASEPHLIAFSDWDYLKLWIIFAIATIVFVIINFFVVSIGALLTIIGILELLGLVGTLLFLGLWLWQKHSDSK